MTEVREYVSDYWHYIEICPWREGEEEGVKEEEVCDKQGWLYDETTLIL